MKRVIVSVSILLLLFVGIPLAVGGAWLAFQEDDDPAIELAYFVWGGSAGVIGFPLCLGALSLVLGFTPWGQRIVGLLFKLPIWTKK